MQYELSAWIKYNPGLDPPNPPKISLRLNVKNRTLSTDILQSHGEPVVVENDIQLCTLFCDSGSVSATVSIPRESFSPGERIPVSINVTNNSPRQVRISSKLQKRVTLTFSGGKRVLSTTNSHRGKRR